MQGSERQGREAGEGGRGGAAEQGNRAGAEKGGQGGAGAGGREGAERGGREGAAGQGRGVRQVREAGEGRQNRAAGEAQRRVGREGAGSSGSQGPHTHAYVTYCICYPLAYLLPPWVCCRMVCTGHHRGRAEGSGPPLCTGVDRVNKSVETLEVEEGK